MFNTVYLKKKGFEDLLKVEMMTVGPIQENTYVVINEATNEALIVDPGEESERLVQWIKGNNWQPVAVLLTHCHSDHIGALDAVRAAFNIEAYVHEIERDFITDPNLNLSALQPFPNLSQRPAEHHWTEMGKKTIGPFEFEVRHVPGHSPGHVVYIFRDDAFVVVGDAVFNGSIGRTDLPGGNLSTLMQGIAQYIVTLPGHFLLYPGHGEKTTIQNEILYNPYFEAFRQ